MPTNRYPIPCSSSHLTTDFGGVIVDTASPGTLLKTGAAARSISCSQLTAGWLSGLASTEGSCQAWQPGPLPGCRQLWMAIQLQGFRCGLPTILLAPPQSCTLFPTSIAPESFPIELLTYSSPAQPVSQGTWLERKARNFTNSFPSI